LKHGLPDNYLTEKEDYLLVDYSADFVNWYAENVNPEVEGVESDPY